MSDDLYDAGVDMSSDTSPDFFCTGIKETGSTIDIHITGGPDTWEASMFVDGEPKAMLSGPIDTVFDEVGRELAVVVRGEVE